MKLLMGSIAVVAVMLSGQALASGKMDMAAGGALAKKSGCTACHAVDKKTAGPSLKDIAAKYKGNAKAEDMLIAKVSKGGSGVWGTMPMPPNPAVKPADMKKLVAWVLAH